MLHCHFCGTAVADVETAIQAHWLPSFYDEQQEVAEPVCPSCTSGRLHVAIDGVHELASHTRYADEAESAQRAGAWPQAAALWQRAASLCADVERRAYYAKQAAWCGEMPEIVHNTDSQED